MCDQALQQMGTDQVMGGAHGWPTSVTASSSYNCNSMYSIPGSTLFHYGGMDANPSFWCRITALPIRFCQRIEAKAFVA